MLLGEFYSRISIGDTFDLCFDRFWLISHNVVSSDENALNKVITAYAPAVDSIDKEDIAKSIILAASLRKKINKVSLNPDSSLELCFENGVSIRFTTDTEIVDWQWAINEKGGDPYIGCSIGCFDAGKVEVGNS